MQSEKKHFFISVIIPTYHDWIRLKLCLEALEIQTYPKEWFEVIVVNNDPEDPLPKDINLPSNCKIVVESKPGSYAARNTGAAYAKGDVLSFTDADCKPREDWLYKINMHYCSSDDALSGAVEMFSLNNEKLNFSESYDYIYGINQEIYIEKGVAATANLSTRKEYFILVNGFDDKVFSGGDVDFCKRLKDKGLNLFYRDDVIVCHPLRNSFSDLLTKARRLAAGKIRRNFILGIILVLSPPIVRLKILFFKKKAPASVKIKAAFVLFFIKLYQVVFLPLMVIGKTNERR